jgi:hypothetical protein
VQLEARYAKEGASSTVLPELPSSKEVEDSLHLELPEPLLGAFLHITSLILGQEASSWHRSVHVRLLALVARFPTAGTHHSQVRGGVCHDSSPLAGRVPTGSQRLRPVFVRPV